MNLRLVNPDLRRHLSHDFQYSIHVHDNLEVDPRFLEHLRVESILEFFEYDKDLSCQVI